MTEQDARVLAELLVTIASTEDTVDGGFYWHLDDGRLTVEGSMDLSPDELAALRRALDAHTRAPNRVSAHPSPRHHDQTMNRRTTAGA